jgi:thioredoxin 1
MKKQSWMKALLATVVSVGMAGVAVPVHAQAMTGPMVKKNLYPPVDAAAGQIKAALEEARRTHKRVILDFGGDWCGDCQVLDIYFHQSPNQELLEKNFIKVNVNIGRMDANVDIAHKYGVPLKGVPALAVLDSRGNVLVSQNLEFADMRHMEPTSVTEFLNKWKP